MSTAHKQYSRKTAAILTVLAMLLGLFPIAAFASHGQFPDVSGVLAPEIKAAHDAGLVDGYDDGTFRPNENVTRAAFAKFIVQAVEEATGKALEKGDEPFSDVTPNQALYEYVVKAYKAGYIQGYGDGTFGYNKDITRQEAAAILQRALQLPAAKENFDDVADNSAFADEIGAVAAAGIMKGYDAKKFGPGDKVTRGAAAAVAYRGYNYLVEKNAKYEVVSVAAVSSKSLRVTFNKAVQDTAAAKFEVKRDGISVSVTPTWSDDKKSVDLMTAAKLVAGTYTVTVTGLDFAEGKNTGSVAVRDEEVAKIELLGDKLVKSASSASEASIPFRVLNQYGEDITKSALATEIQWTAVPGSAAVNQAGVLTVAAPSNDSDGWSSGDKVVVTGVHPATGITVSKTLTVAEAAGLTSFSFGEVIYPEDTDRIYVGSNPAGWIAVSATDENGNPVDANYLNNAVVLYPTNNVQVSFVTKDGKPAIQLNTTSAIAGKVNITAVVKLNPSLNKTVTVEVADRPYPARVDLGSFDGILALNDPAETLVVPLTVYDQFGNVMSAKDVAAAASGSQPSLTVAVAGQTGLLVGIDTEGDNVGKLVNTGWGNNPTTGYATITIVATRTGSSDTIRVQVSPARKPAELVVPANITKNLLFGASTSIELGFKDQYGASFDVAEQAYDTAAFKYRVINSAPDIVTVSVGSQTADEDGVEGTTLGDLTDIDVTAAQKEGSSTVTVQLLQQKSGSSTFAVISEVSFSLTVAKATSSLQYSIAEIPALYRDADGDGTVEGSSEAAGVYAERVRIIAKDASGNTYAVNPASIVSYTSSSSLVGIGDIDSNTSGLQLGVWSQATTQDLANGDVKATITVTFNTADGSILTMQAPVTVSASGRSPVALHIWSSGLSTPARELPDGDAIKKLKYSTTTSQFEKEVYLLVEDQFGRFWPAVTGATAGVANVQSGVTFSNFTVNYGADGEVTISGVSGQAGKTFDLVFLTSNGKTATLTVELQQ